MATKDLLEAFGITSVRNSTKYKTMILLFLDI